MRTLMEKDKDEARFQSYVKSSLWTICLLLGIIAAILAGILVRLPL